MTIFNIADLDGTSVHEVLSEVSNLALGGLAGQVSAADLATALYVANYAFQANGFCPAQPS